MTDTHLHTCWSCKGPVDEAALFCPTCQAVQAPARVDHFTRLGLTESFDVDEAALEKGYFAQQRSLHPDRFARKSPKERALSQQQAASLNEAYNTLRDPLKRADYLVHLRGAEDVLPDGCNLVNDPSLLMEAMEMREALAEAEGIEDVHCVAREAQGEIDSCLARLSRAFAHNDLEAACRQTTRLKYLTKLVEETRVAAHRIGAAAEMSA